jgi:hypothetical protein
MPCLSCWPLAAHPWLVSFPRSRRISYHCPQILTKVAFPFLVWIKHGFFSRQSLISIIISDIPAVSSHILSPTCRDVVHRGAYSLLTALHWYHVLVVHSRRRAALRVSHITMAALPRLVKARPNLLEQGKPAFTWLVTQRKATSRVGCQGGGGRKWTE